MNQLDFKSAYAVDVYLGYIQRILKIYLLS